MLTDSEWAELLFESTRRSDVKFGDLFLPGFPPSELQINTTGMSGVDALFNAFKFYLICKRQFAAMNQPLIRGKRLLDFGVGWGRVARCFIRDLGIDNIFGTDVTPDFIDICSKTFRSSNFMVNDPYPPVLLPNERFEFIISCSVFSHLSNEAYEKWMGEFHRILVPGGCLVLTTRGRDFFDVCEAINEHQSSGYGLALSKLFPDFSAARRAYDEGNFVHSNIQGVSGGGEMNSTFYGETFIPEPYARRVFGTQFEMVRFIDEAQLFDQAIIFFRKI
jgi:ubiquinone/menaquinone biosynthesis C-methylase UbiE